MKNWWGLARRLVGYLGCCLLVHCSPPDKPIESANGRRTEVTPLSVPENPGLGYSVYLLGRLHQAAALLEESHQKNSTAGFTRSDKTECRFEKISATLSPERSSYYLKYDSCKTRDGRVEAQVQGEEAISAVYSAIAGPGESGISPVNHSFILQSLTYRTLGIKVRLNPLKEVNLALGKMAEIDERVELNADLIGHEYFSSEENESPMVHLRSQYQVYFRTSPESKVFQNLVSGEMAATENLAEIFNIYGIFEMVDGRVVSFSQGQLRLETSGSRRVRSRDRKTQFSKFNQVQVTLETYAKEGLQMVGECGWPKGRLKVKLSRPEIMNPPQENKGVAKALQLDGQQVLDLRTSNSHLWPQCGELSGFRAIPYGHLYLR